MMLRVWRRIVALSDPQLTADFQRICGIRSLDEQTVSDSTGLNISSSTIDRSTEECLDWLQQLEQVQGNSVIDNTHSHTVQNVNIPWPCQLGCTSTYDGSLKSRHGHSNGFIRHSGVQNGDVTPSHLQNGLAYQCQHEASTQSAAPQPQVNGLIHICSKNTTTAASEVAAKNPKEKATFVIENTLLYYIFSFGASLGNEIFYVIFFASGLWTSDSYVLRKVSVIWVLVMYLGQAAKDLICWPRPSSPPAVRLEDRYELEYGMPSTHAMVGIVIPFGLLYYTYGYYEYDIFLGILVAVLWCVLVSFSRLYLGMHSVLDIVAGIVSASVVMICIIPFVDMIDCLLIAHPWCFPGLNILGLALTLLYPELKVWSTARGDTTQVIAVFSGIYQGMWYTAQVTTPEMAETASQTALTGWAALASAFGCLLLGLLLMVTLLDRLKKFMVFVMATLLRLDPHDPTCKQHFWVELPYKYVGYFVPSFCSAYFMPIVFQYLGWHRRHYLTETLHHSHHFGL